MAREHIRAFRDVPGVAVVGIYNRTRARAEALAVEYGIPVVADSVAELCERTRADLVVMAVLETAANAVAQSCFEFPWTVLMEKPPGLNLADARAIQSAARRRQRRVLVALNRRFLASTQVVLADLATNPEPRFIHAQDQEDLKSAASFGYPKELVANWMYANSIHVVDYLRVFGRGAVRSVSPSRPWDGRSPGVVVATIEFDSGDHGLYTAVWNGPAPWSVSVSTPAKRWELRPLEQAAFQLQGERRQQTIEMSGWDQQFKPGFRLQAENAVRAARGLSSDSPTLDEAVATMELIGAIYGNG